MTRNHDWTEPFILALAESGIVSTALSEAGVSRDTAYTRRKEDPEFADRWRAALDEAADMLEFEARRRAERGVDEPVIYQGTVAGGWFDEDGKPCKPDEPGGKFIPITVRKYSDTLLIFLLKAARPKKFRDNVKVQQSGKVDQNVTISIQPSMSRLIGNPELYAKAVELADQLNNDN